MALILMLLICYLLACGAIFSLLMAHMPEDRAEQKDADQHAALNLDRQWRIRA